MIKGLFDLQTRMERIDKNGDPLAVLDKFIDWEQFRPALEALRIKPRKSNAGAKGYDLVLMFKALILQSLYNISDEQLEYQILDRFSFSRFLGIDVGGKVPDCTTFWHFKEAMASSGLERKLFEQFDSFLRENGFAARKGQIIDATIVQSPRQRNTRDENEKIKQGDGDEVKQTWPKNKRRQKDTDARWTKKNGENYFGYKNHIQADVKDKFIRDYRVTDASVHDSNVFIEMLDPDNSSADVYADSAYMSEEHREQLEYLWYRERIHRKGSRGSPLSERERRGNRAKSKVRARIEHIFGVTGKRMGDTILRCVGKVRARCKIGLRNLAYNLDRFSKLSLAGA